MKTFKLSALIHFVLMLMLLPSFAADGAKTAPSTATIEAAKAPAKTPDLFRSGEWQIDAIYQARTDDFSKVTHGGGVGLTYFVTKNLGVGLEGRTEKPESAFFDRLGAAIVGRLPIESMRLAPEVRAGFDYDLEDSWEAGEKKRRTGFDAYAGVGAEYRITKSLGVGLEARSVFPIGEQERNHYLGLARLRLNF